MLTLPQLWRRRCAEGGEGAALRHKESGIWKALSWSDYYSEARAVGMALAKSGLQSGDVVSVLSDNRPEWLITDMAAQAMGFVAHGLYPCRSAAQVGHALKEAGSHVVVVENADQLLKVLGVRDSCPDLRQIVVIETRGLRRFSHPEVLAYEQWRAAGAEAAERRPAEFDARIEAGSGQEVAFLASTAGSTGHARLVAVRQSEVLADVRTPHPWLPLQPHDRLLSMVSLANRGERLLSAKAMLMNDAQVHFAENPGTVLNDLVEVSPHFVFAAPRLLEKLQGATELFMHEALPIARKAYAASLAASGRGWWQRKVRDRIRAALGLRHVRQALISGASGKPHVAAWFEAIGVPVRNGYGIAEVGFCTDAEMKLAPDGEILVQAGRRRPRYWVRGEISGIATDEQGWLPTGDLGRIDEAGRVRPLGRMVSRVTDARGEPVSPESVEEALRMSVYIADAVVVPRADGRFGALLALDAERIRKHAQERRLSFTDYESLLARPEIDALVAAQVEIANGRLPESHRVRGVGVIPRPLHPGDEELTPAMRLNRQVVAQRHAALLPAAGPRTSTPIKELSP